MKKPNVTVVEDKSGAAILLVGFDGGKSVTVMFFAEPETEEEMSGQVRWRIMQSFFRFCRGKDCDDDCYGCAWAWRGVFLVLIAALFGPFIGIAVAVLGAGFFAALVISLVLRFLNRHERAELRRQKAWLKPIEKRLAVFEEADDLRGALNYAVEVCKV